MNSARAYDLSDPEPIVPDGSPPMSIERGELAVRLLRQLLGGIVYPSDKQLLFADLFAAAAETTTQEWRDRGGTSTSSETLQRALAFLFSLPVGVPLPDVLSDQNGDITVEWYTGPRNVLSVIVGSHPNLAYAALAGASTSRGTEPFVGRFPDAFAVLLRRIYPA
ncbi:MAG TPA: hypothetical protein VK679_06900 [Gemmatimonadaceae bacterium]|jgi:hypothetical protein|nr:hypothetical protein [Gemmatimonadaceae bacterium]